MPGHLRGALLGLLSALVWGSGDFGGGLATRRSSPFQTLFAATLAGLAALLSLAAIRGEALPPPADLRWSAAAGLAGAVGMAALYRALAVGSAAVVAPTSAVVGAALPVLWDSVLEGLAAPNKLAGFALGLLGIGLVARATPEANGADRRGLGAAVLAGLGFGAFFVLIAQVGPGAIWLPLAIAKSSSLGLAALALLLRGERPPAPRANPVAWLAGLLDAGGNSLYLLAQQFTRLDVAAVLASMYPASTVLLARLVCKQTISWTQAIGVILCLAATALIAL